MIKKGSAVAFLRLKDIEKESARLKREVAELTLDKQILQEALTGSWGRSPDAGRR